MVQVIREEEVIDMSVSVYIKDKHRDERITSTFLN